jgi:hypothetical protein
MEVVKAKRITVNLKFTKSDKNGAYVAFVSRNPVTKKISGVRANSVFPKEIVLVDKNLAHFILPNVLYRAVIIPMIEKDGYIAVEASPITFEATVETFYIPHTTYRLEVKFGGKTIIFNPMKGKKDSVRTIAGVRGVLENRMDIDKLPQVIADFNEAACELMKRYEYDNVELLSYGKRL